MNGRDMVAVCFRYGFIESIDPATVTARVRFEDLENLVSGDLQIIRQRAREEFDYWMYEKNEEVLCLFIGHGLGIGFILGAVSTLEDPPPVTDPNKRHIAFRDGTWFEYDRHTHELAMHVEGSVTVFAKGDIKAEAGGRADISAKGDISVKAEGNLTLEAGGLLTLKGKRIELNCN